MQFVSYQKATKHKLLTKEEEVDLAQKMEKGDKRAREKLISSNLRLAISIANNYPYILDKCNKITSVVDYINTKYSVQCHKNTQGVKIIAFLNNYWFSEE